MSELALPKTDYALARESTFHLSKSRNEIGGIVYTEPMPGHWALRRACNHVTEYHTATAVDPMTRVESDGPMLLCSLLRPSSL